MELVGFLGYEICLKICLCVFDGKSLTGEVKPCAFSIEDDFQKILRNEFNCTVTVTI